MIIVRFWEYYRRFFLLRVVEFGISCSVDRRVGLERVVEVLGWRGALIFRVGRALFRSRLLRY